MSARVKHVLTHDGKHYGYSFNCPGCEADKAYSEVWGSEHTVTTPPSAQSNGATWGFNGDTDRPTFTPSIHVHPHGYFDKNNETRQSPRCHSFVTDGRIQFLADCTHPLAGQTVDLPEIETSP